MCNRIVTRETEMSGPKTREHHVKEAKGPYPWEEPPIDLSVEWGLWGPSWTSSYLLWRDFPWVTIPWAINFFLVPVNNCWFIPYKDGSKKFPQFSKMFFSFFKILLIYLRERESTQRERETEEQKHTPCWARSLMWDSIPGPWDHDLSRRQMLNWLSHPSALRLSDLA